MPANGAVNLPAIVLGATTRFRLSALACARRRCQSGAAGPTRQLLVTASYPDGATKNVSGGHRRHNYTISNPAIATVTRTAW